MAQTRSKTSPHSQQATPRQGPRPLPLHMSTLSTSWMSSRAAFPYLKSGSLPWSPDLKNKAEALFDEIAAHPDNQFLAALDAEALLRTQEFQRGVKVYQNHPYERDVTDPKAIWEEGGSRLLDYGGPENGPVCLVVPSLINKAYILDLNKKRSFMRALAKKGMRCFLLSWGEIGDTEKQMELDDYILGRLSRCVDAVNGATCDQPVNLIGYCMGGVLTTAFTTLEADRVASLVLLATPWDFLAGDGAYQRIINSSRYQLTATIDMLGLLPIDAIQSVFTSLDPFQAINKFGKFGKIDQDSPEALRFVAMEDWLNDGVPLAGKVARECLFDWYLENKPATYQWEMDGHIIDPREIQCPTAIFIPKKDRIVPPESAAVLAHLIPKADRFDLGAGHVGMITGRQAVKNLYEPLSNWLLSKAEAK